MVWGMALPEGFDEFWPSGAFESIGLGHQGWFERLKSYYSEQMPAERKASFDDGHGNGPLHYMGYAVGKFTGEVGGSVGDDPPFTPIEPHEPPKFFTMAKSQKSLGSLIVLNDSILAVEDTLKQLIERLEPGVHQFFPIEIRTPRGKTYPASYYLLVMRHLDAFSPEDTKVGSVTQRGSGSFRLDKTKTGMIGLAMRKALFGDAHLWRERRFSKELVCFSDALHAEIEKAGLRIPKHHKLKEVIDDPDAQRAQGAG